MVMLPAEHRDLLLLFVLLTNERRALCRHGAVEIRIPYLLNNRSVILSHIDRKHSILVIWLQTGLARTHVQRFCQEARAHWF